MELRHLRFFVAVAEEGSLTTAAGKRLHTAQPSLSRQIRDLEYEVGAQLLTRSARGVELTPAGRAFLDHARLALAQVEAAGTAARRASQPAKASFALGFLTGQEMDWLPEVMRTLRDELPSLDVTVSSHYSPDLADGLMRGKLDLAFMRREANMPDLEYRLVVREPIVAVMPSDHRLARQKSVTFQEIAREPFIHMSTTAPVFRQVIEDYFREHGLAVKSGQHIDNLGMAMSLVASTRSLTLLPAYARNFLTWSVTSRPIAGGGPAIDLVIGYHKANRSQVLKLFLSRVDDLIARVDKTRETA
ncbi:MAG TPA: LysR family transcriptional regulator [Rhizomicrobium sp.]|jgi:LysR family hca operon transcriptional activator|nr:LysR family transcriptional regulator [Rhizomicrobium sp.]